MAVAIATATTAIVVTGGAAAAPIAAMTTGGGGLATATAVAAGAGPIGWGIWAVGGTELEADNNAPFLEEVTSNYDII